MWSGLHATSNTPTPPMQLVDIQQGDNILISISFPEIYLIFIPVSQVSDLSHGPARPGRNVPVFFSRPFPSCH